MKLLFAALAIATSPIVARAQAVAPPVAAAAPDPARLTLARSLVDVLFPPATREQMMQSMLTPMLANLQRGMTQDPAFTSAMDRDPRVRKLFDAFMARQTAQAMEQVRNSLPGMSAAMANAYARKFDLAQLRDIKAFFETPSGHAYIQGSMSIMGDPDVAAWQRSMMTGSMSRVQADVADFAKQVSALKDSGAKP